MNFRFKRAIALPVIVMLGSMAAACGGDSTVSSIGLLAQVPDGYDTVERTDVKDLVKGDGLDDLT